MADDEGDHPRSRRMDLNLYLGFPCSPLPQSEDLGSGLALAMPPPSAADPDPEPVVETRVEDFLSDTLDDPIAQEPRDPPANLPVVVELDFGPYLPVPAQIGEPSSPPEQLRDPESRFLRLIDSSRRLHGRRSRPPAHYGSPGPSYDPADDQLVRSIMGSQRALTATRKNRGHGGAVDGSEGEKEERGRGKANFECNICFDMAKDPVVTSCGHLFCWPCLYQWLHLHSDQSECPVCKGQVVEGKVTPIYGRGPSEPTLEEKCGEEAGFLLKIPPRPHGHRLESWRQQLQRSATGRLEGVPALWGPVLEEDGASLQSLLDGTRRRALNRLWRMQREVGNPESGSNARGVGLLRDDMANPLPNSASSLLRGEILDDFTNSLVAISADIHRVSRRLHSTSGQAGASTSSVNHHVVDPWIASTAPPETPLAVNQVSASSTMAVIQEDIAINNTPAEPNGAGTSRPIRRRARNTTSESFDVDGGELHARKRRRLN